MSDELLNGRQVVHMMVDGSAESIFSNACEYREAVQLLMGAYDGRIVSRMFGPLYHLSGVCIELALKAYLLEGGIEKRKTHQLGHKLDQLLHEATRLGLVLDDRLCRQIGIASETAQNAFFRYGLDRGAQTPPYSVPIPHMPTLWEAIEALMSAVALRLDIPWPDPAGR